MKRTTSCFTDSNYFKVKKLLAVTFLFLFVINTTYALDLVWVGNPSNTGPLDWNDEQNWRVGSASGAIPNTSPTSNDNVSFDANGDYSGGIVLNGANFCANLIWDISGYASAPVNIPSLIFNYQSTLSVNGSFDIPGPDYLTYNGNGGSLLFEGGGDQLQVLRLITVGASQTINSKVDFEGNYEWRFESDINVSSTLSLTQGHLNFNGKNVTVQRFESFYTTLNRTLDIVNSTLTIGAAVAPYQLNSTNLTFHAAGSQITFTNTGVLRMQHAGTPTAPLVYHNVYVNGGDATIDGGFTFSELKVKNKCYLPGSNTIGNLVLEEASKLTLYPTTIQEVSNITTLGTCSGITQIQSLWSGVNAVIKTSNSAGIFNLNELYIEDVDLNTSSGLPSYTTSGFYNLTPTTSTGWAASSSLVGQNYVWNGGSGNWSDPAKWSVGGVSTGCLPSPIDNVFFGATTGVVTIDERINYCRDMDWKQAPSNAELVSINPPVVLKIVNELNIYGSLLLGSALNFSFDGDFNFKSHETNNVIDAEANVLNANLIFNGSGGEWKLDEDLETTQDITVSGGVFDAQGNDITAYEFASKYSSPRTIDIENSIINVERWHMDNGINPITRAIFTFTKDASLLFLSDGSTINIAANPIPGVTNVLMRWGAGEKYHNVHVWNATNFVELRFANLEFDLLELQGTTNLSVNPIADLGVINNALILHAGNRYTFRSEMAFTSLGTLVANGNCNNYINIEEGSFSSTNPSTITVDHCIINNNVITSGNFSATNSVISDPQSGWGTGASAAPRTLHFKASANDDSWNTLGNWYAVYSYDPATGTDSYTNPAPLSCPPGPRDNVVFHFSSFDNLSSPSVTLPENQTYCLSMSWKDAPSGETYPSNPSVSIFGDNSIGSVNSQNLVIFGELKLQNSSILNWEFPGVIEFKQNDASASTRNVDVQDIAFKKDVLIDVVGTNELILQSNLSVSAPYPFSNIRHNSGTLNTNGFDISCSEYNITGHLTKKLDARKSATRNTTLNFSWFTETPRGSSNASTGTTLEFDATTMNCSGEHAITSNNMDFSGCNVFFTNTATSNDGAALVGSGNIFENATFEGNGIIKGSNTFQNLNLKASHQYKLANGSEQDILAGGGINIIGIPTTRTRIITQFDQGNRAFIDSEEHFCLNEVYLNRIEAFPVNNQALVAGEISEAGTDVRGWAFTQCEPETLETCVGKAIQFNPGFTGCSQVWNFGDMSTELTQNNPSYTYTSTGTYNVFMRFETPCLTGQNTVGEDARNYVVIVNRSCCDVADFPNHTIVSGSITSNTIWGDKIFVEGNISVEQGVKLDITNSDVVFSDGTGIYVRDNSVLEVNNSTLRSCGDNGLWDNIYFLENSSGKIRNNVISNASNSVRLSTIGNVDVLGNQFTNCITSVYVDQGSGTDEVDHVISNNNFTLNNDIAYLTSAPTVVYRGIQLSDVTMQNSISLNEFNYTYTIPEGRNLIGYGIQLTSSSADISDNTFLNVLYGYTQNANDGISSFDNNTITYNNAYELTSGRPISITNVNNLTTISNNTIRSSTPLSGNGIYFSNGDNLVIDGNTIDRFSFGIYAQGSDALEITNNKITNIVAYGLFVRDCYENTKIADNVIDKSNGRGMRCVYDEDKSTSTVEITGNCILNTGRSMELISSIQCLSLPVVENNYQHNYGSGLIIQNFNGNLGTSGNPAGNSFISNSGGIDLNIVNCSVTSFGNWPQLLRGPGSTSFDQIEPKSSTSTCGTRVASLRKVNVNSASYLKAAYGLSFVNSNADYSEQTFSKVESSDNSFGNAQVVVRVLLQNDEATAAKNFLADALLQLNLSSQENAWLAYLVAKSEMDWTEANTWLNLAKGVEGLYEGDVELEQLKVQVFSTGRTITEMNSAEKQELYQLYGRSNNTHVRGVIHVLDKDHPFIYEFVDIEALTNIQYTEIGLKGEELTLYPNPTSGALNLHLKVMPNESSEVMIVDMYGRMLKRQTIPALQNKLSLDLSELRSGMYYLRLKNDRGEFQSTFQVLK